MAAKKPSAKKPKNKGGRPKTPLDVGELEKLAGLQCTHAEIAAWFGCSTKTIQRRLQEEADLAEAVERGQGKGLISLRRTQFRLSEKNAAMAIFLGKQYLGQADKQELTGKDGGPVRIGKFSDLTDDDLATLERIYSKIAPGSGAGGNTGGTEPTRH